MLFADDVIYFTTEEGVGFSNQAVFAMRIGLLGHLAAQRCADVAATHEAGTGARAL